MDTQRSAMSDATAESTLPETPQDAATAAAPAAPPAIPTFSEWLSQAPPPADPLDTYRGYSNFAKVQLLKAGEYSPDTADELDTALAEHAITAGIDLGNDPAKAFRSSAADPDMDAVERHTLDTQNLPAYEATREYRAMLNPTLRASYDDKDEYEAKLEEARLKYVTSATPDVRNAANRAALVKGEIPFAVFTDADADGVPTQRLEISPALAKGADDKTLAAIFEANPQLDRGLIGPVREKLRVPEGFDKPLFVLDRAQDFNSAYNALMTHTNLDKSVQNMVTNLDKGDPARLDASVEWINERLKGTPLETEFSADERKQFLKDMIVRSSSPATNTDNLDANFVKLSTGEYHVPMGLMLNKPLFDKAVKESKAIPEAQKELLELTREARVSAIAPSSFKIITAKRPEFAGFFQERKDKGATNAAILDEWMGNPENHSTTMDYLKGTGESVVEGLGGLVLYPLALAGSDSARGVLSDLQKSDTDRRAYAQLFGKNLGAGYDLARLVAPVAADVATTFGVGAAVKGTLKATAGSAVRAAIKGTLENALSSETKGVLRSFTLRSATRDLVEGSVARAAATGNRITGEAALNAVKAEARPVVETLAVSDPDIVLKMAGNDIARQISKTAMTSSYLATAFNRSAGSTYVQIYSTLSEQKDAKGQPKYTPEQVREISLGHGLLAGTITAAVTGGFSFLGHAGLQSVFGEGVTPGQMRAVLTKVKSDGPLRNYLKAEGVDLATVDTFMDTAIKRGLRPLWQTLSKDAMDEGMEEGLDQFLNYFHQQQAVGEKINLTDAVTQAGYAAFLGGVMGAGVPGIKAMFAGRMDAGEEASARRGLMFDAAAMADRKAQLLQHANKLDAANLTQTARVLREAALNGVPASTTAAGAAPASTASPSGQAGPAAAPVSGGVDVPQPGTGPVVPTEPLPSGDTAAATGTLGADTQADVPAGVGEAGVEQAPSGPAVAAVAETSPEVATAEPAPEPAAPAPPVEAIATEFQQLLPGVEVPRQRSLAGMRDAVRARIDGIEATYESGEDVTKGEANHLKSLYTLLAGIEARMLDHAKAVGGITGKPLATADPEVAQEIADAAQPDTTPETNPPAAPSAPTGTTVSVETGADMKRDSSKPEQMTPEELGNLRKAQNVKIAQDNLDAAKKGHEQPNVFTNGTKSKAALVKKRMTELKEATEAKPNPDLWDTLVEASYRKVPIADVLVQGFSDGPNGEARTVRQQAIDNLTDKGYIKEGDFYVWKETPAAEPTLPPAALDRALNPDPAADVADALTSDPALTEARIIEDPAAMPAVEDVLGRVGIITEGLDPGDAAFLLNAVGEVPMAEPSESLVPQSESSILAGQWQPNSVVFAAVSFPNHESLGVIQVQHDGSPKAISKARDTAMMEAERKFGSGISNSASLSVSTDETGRVSHMVSANGKISKIDSPDARYAAGDVNAYRDDSLKRIQAAKKSGNPDEADAIAQERIDDLEKRISEIGHDESKPESSLDAGGRSIRKYVSDMRTEITKWQSLMTRKVSAAHATPTPGTRVVFSHPSVGGAATGVVLDEPAPGGKIKVQVDGKKLKLNVPDTSPVVGEPPPPPDKHKRLPSHNPAIDKSSVTAELNAHNFKSGTTAFLKSVAAKGPKHQQAVARLLLEFPELLAATPVTLVHLPKGAFAGALIPSTGQVLVNTAMSGPRGAVDTVLHELLHAATVQSIVNPTPAQAKILARLERVRQSVAKRANGDPVLEYATKSLDEFVTHFFTSPQFQQQVAALTPKGQKNWVQVILDTIRELLGAKRKSAADATLEGVMNDMILFTRDAAARTFGPRKQTTASARAEALLLPAYTSEMTADLQQFIIAKKDRILDLTKRIDRAYETNRTKGVESMEAELDSLLEDMENRVDSQENADEDSIKYQGESDAAEFDSANPDAASELVMALQRWEGKGYVNANDQTRIQEEYKTFPVFVRRLMGDSQWTIREGVTDAQIQTAAEDATKAYERRRNSMIYGTPRAEQLLMLPGTPAPDGGASIRDTVRFHELTAGIEETPEGLAAWTEANPEAHSELERMRAEVLRGQGYDIPAYHGTDAPEFTVFNTEREIKGGKTRDPNAFVGSHFARNKFAAGNFADGLYDAKGGRVMSVMLKMDNPLRMGLGATKGSNLLDGLKQAYEEAADSASRTEMANPRPQAPDWAFEEFRKDGDITKFLATVPPELEAVRAAKDGSAKAFRVLRDAKESNRPVTERELLAFAGYEWDTVFESLERKGKGYALKVGRDVRNKLEAAGYDGVEYENAYAEETGVGGDRVSYIAFDPNQIKSASPLALDPATGKLIPPNQWGDAGSNDIRFLPAVEVAENADTQFNNEINKYVTGEWPADPWERRTKIEIFTQKWLSGRYPGVVIRRSRSPGAKSALKFVGNSEHEVVLGDESTIKLVNEPTASEAEVYSRIASTIDEEVIHWAHIKAIKQRLGPSENPNLAAFNEVIDSAKSMLSAPMTPNERATLERGLAASLSLYTPVRMPEGFDSLNWLAGKLDNPTKEAENEIYKATGELVRMVVQMRRTGVVSESTFSRMWDAVKQWFEDNLAALKKLVTNHSVVGPKITQDIKATEAILDEMETRNSNNETRANTIPRSPSSGILGGQVEGLYDQGASAGLGYAVLGDLQDPTSRGSSGDIQFTAETIRDTALGFVPDGINPDDLNIDYDELARQTEGHHPANAEDIIRSTVNRALSHKAGMDALGADATPEDAQRFADTLDRIATGNTAQSDIDFYRSNPTVLARLVRYLTAALKSAWVRLSLRWDARTAVMVDRMTRTLGRAENGFGNREVREVAGVVRMLPSITPADQFAPQSEKFNKEVQKYVTGNWPEDAAGRQAELSAFADRWARPLSDIFTVQRESDDSFTPPPGIARGPNGYPATTHVQGRDKIIILVGEAHIHALATNPAYENLGEEGAKRALALIIQEEGAHAAYYESVRRKMPIGAALTQAIKADSEEILGDIHKAAQEPTQRAKIDKALYAAAAIYIEAVRPDEEGTSALSDIAELPFEKQRYILTEFMRQVIQMRNEGEITETYTRKILNSVIAWFKRQIDAIREVATGKVVISDRFSQAIAETEAVLKRSVEQNNIRFLPSTTPAGKAPATPATQLTAFTEIRQGEAGKQGKPGEAGPRKEGGNLPVSVWDRIVLAVTRPSDLTKSAQTIASAKRNVQTAAVQQVGSLGTMGKKLLDRVDAAERPRVEHLIDLAAGSNRPLLTAEEDARITRIAVEATDAANADAQAAKDAARDTYAKEYAKVKRRADNERLAVADDPALEGREELKAQDAVLKRLADTQEVLRLNRDESITAIHNKQNDRLRDIRENERNMVNQAKFDEASRIRQAQDNAVAELNVSHPAIGEWISKFRTAVNELQTKLMDDPNTSDSLKEVIGRSIGSYLVRSYEIHNRPGFGEAVRINPEYEGTRNALIGLFESRLVEREMNILRGSTDEFKALAPDEVTPELEAAAGEARVAREYRRIVNTPDQAGKPEDDVRRVAGENVAEQAQILFEEFILGHEGMKKSGVGLSEIRVEFERYMKKTDLPQEILDALGEIKDPILNLTRTYNAVSDLLATQRALAEYKEAALAGGWIISKEEFDSGNQKYRSWKPLVASDVNSPAYAPLSGWYASPEQEAAFKARFMSNPKNRENSAQTVLNGVMNYAYGAAGMSLGVVTLGNPAKYMRDILGGYIMAASQGALPFSAKGSSVTTWQAAFGGKTGAEQEAYALKLISLGVLNNGVHIGMLKDAFAKMRENPKGFLDALQEVTAKGSTRMAELIGKGRENSREFVEMLGKLSQFTESIGNISVYERELSALRDAKWADTEAELEQEAARRVRMVMPSKDQSSQLVTEWTKTPLGLLLAPFIRFKAEMIRTVFNTYKLAWQDVHSGNPVMRVHGLERFATAGAVHGGLTIGMSMLAQAIAGIGDDEDRAIRAAMPIYAKNSSFIYIRKPNGGLQTWDLTYLNPFSFTFDPFTQAIKALYNGRFDDLPKVAARFVFTEFFGENITASALLDVNRNVDANTNMPIYLDTDTQGDKIYKAITHVLGGAYNPAVLKKPFQAVTAMSRPAKADDPFFYTPAGVLTTLVAPVKPRDYKIEDLAYRAMANLRKANAQLWQYTAPLMSPAPLNPKDVAGIYQQRMDASRRINRQMWELAQGYEKLGMRRAAVVKKAEDAGFSRDKANRVIVSGMMERPVLNEDSTAKMHKIDPARAKAYRTAVAKYPSLIRVKD